ncbi:hypothetical protein A9Q84_19925 [Halobacteriovorax marinus]|uniref:Lipoprotein n=1 Tax=Halobacteriovorax marinus TaxID=97084 RepID=A0A1Y5F3B5_9BACT|nr:hypothetical protein A9Q84_19925 [Halobacteriovorax marinus]
MKTKSIIIISLLSTLFLSCGSKKEESISKSCTINGVQRDPSACQPATAKPKVIIGNTLSAEGEEGEAVQDLNVSFGPNMFTVESGFRYVVELYANGKLKCNTTLATGSFEITMEDDKAIITIAGVERRRWNRVFETVEKREDGSISKLIHRGQPKDTKNNIQYDFTSTLTFLQSSNMIIESTKCLAKKLK